MQIEREQQRYRTSKPSFIGRGIDRLAHPFGKVAASMMPKGIVEKVLNQLDSLVARLPARSFDHDPTDIDAARDAAGKIQRQSQALNGSTGAAAGVGGIFTMSADIPATIAVAMHHIRDTGRAYGYEGSGPEERMFRLRILELAATGKGDQREKLIAQLERSIRDDGSLIEHQSHEVAPLLDQIVERVSRALAFASAGRRAGMAIPLVGAVVGGAVNASFQRDVARAARFAYQERRLHQRPELSIPTA